MKNKKLIIAGLVIILVVAGFFIMNQFNLFTTNVLDSNTQFEGEIIKVNESSILVEVNDDANIKKTSDVIEVSLNTKKKNHDIKFKIGDIVWVIYDGVIMESYPAQVNGVYEIKLVETK
ncbi:hypothetical protein [Anaerorhabdus sp.]|jgi:hypothetical protein|uniref:hypothetical protein n=1 Tax=Anaerorhabdus sp. TaxID=1872524 RepID=UPI002FCA7E70